MVWTLPGDAEAKQNQTGCSRSITGRTKERRRNSLSSDFAGRNNGVLPSSEQDRLGQDEKGLRVRGGEQGSDNGSPEEHVGRSVDVYSAGLDL